MKLAARLFSLAGEETLDSDKCAICIAQNVKDNAFNRLFTKVNTCRLCRGNACNTHCESLPFARGMIPSRAANPNVCLNCVPRAHSILDDEVEEARVERFNICCKQRAETCRTLQRQSGLRPAAPREESRMCIECDVVGKSQCELCGVTLCTSHVNLYPISNGSKAVGRIKICSQCVELASVQAEARSIVRAGVASVHRSALAAKNLNFSAARIVPSIEDAEDCASCGLTFSKLPGSMRHHCRACGLSLCSVCLCGKSQCLVRGPACPHKATLTHLGFTKSEKVCHVCLPLAQVRARSTSAVKAITSLALTVVNHHDRTAVFVKDPALLPLYEQDYVDTVGAKATRVGDFTVAGAKTALPFLSVPWAFGVHAVNAVWKYGQYGLVGLLAREEVVQALKTLQTMSSVLKNMSTKNVMVGAYYLCAQQRKTLRDDPSASRAEALTNGQPVPLPLLEALVGFALLGGMAPYQERPFDAQRLALQHNWRLVTERLKDSGKHRPAWCLFAHKDQKLATISIRGTDLDASAGGDVWTDLNVLPEVVNGFEGMQMLVHSGALESARLLEFELRPTLRVLANAGYEIAFIGHSIGGAVAAILLWLIKFGSIDERIAEARVFGIGYGAPSIVDRKTADTLRPFFTSIINSMDLVPRLGVSILQKLAQEIQSSAETSKEDLDQDVSAHLNRISTLWEPRLRNGLLPTETGSSTCSPRIPPPSGGDEYADPETNNSPIVDGNIICIEQFIGRTLDSSKDDVFQQQAQANTESVTVTFEPGEIGMFQEDGLVLTVDEGKQAERVGVSAGWKLIAVEGQSCTAFEDKLFEDARKSNTPYQVTFHKAGIEGTWDGGSIRGTRLAWNDGRQSTLHMITPRKFTTILKDEVFIAVLEDDGKLHWSDGDVWQKVPEKKFAIEEVELYVPGSAVWIHRVNGHLEAAAMPCNAWPLRRIILDNRMMEDHKAVSYHQALDSVRRYKVAQESTNAPEDPIWQRFCDAGTTCPCCGSSYDWMHTSRSGKNRANCMTNCRACGRVVCIGCAATYRAVPETGILEPARVCDVCVWRGPDDASTFRNTANMLEALARSTR